MATNPLKIDSKMEKQSEYLHYFYHLTNLGKEMTKIHKVLNADRISDLSSSDTDSTAA